MTSNDVVCILRGILKQKKIGHTGTLDPDATGVLPVCLGSATKLVDMIADRTKDYIAELYLGITTDTEDISGEILSEHQVNCDEKEITDVIMSFIGKSEQIPPMYSAIKVNGKKLYELAREGKVIERKSRPIEVFNIEILNIDLYNRTVKFKINVSKGTYIRSLCRDMGEKLGCGGCMKSLVRSRVGRYFLEDALTLAQVKEILVSEGEGGIINKLTPVDYEFLDYRAITVNGENVKRLANGNWLLVPKDLNPSADEFFRVYDENEEFKALYQYSNDGLKNIKMFV